MWVGLASQITAFTLGTARLRAARTGSTLGRLLLLGLCLRPAFQPHDRPRGSKENDMPDSDERAVSFTCTQCHRETHGVTQSGLCPECDETAMIENIEAHSQRHRENPVAEP